jgi:hypothetical protein
MAPESAAGVCRWTTQSQAVAAFAGFSGMTESGGQIKPLHWYVACRLVVEGGFHPDDVTPRPPFQIQVRRGMPHLSYEPETGGAGERTVLGGLKTKNVDVVVTRDGIGPVLAVSCKGVTGAFRNLTNRMEETIGECTNLHITYPALVLGYLVLLRANLATEVRLQAVETAGEQSQEPEQARTLTANDIAINEDGTPAASIVRFHSALREMVGRRGIRNDISRYEAMAIGLADMGAHNRGSLFPAYPPTDSPLRVDRFFETLYTQYDQRFVTSAPGLEFTTRRLEWAPESQAVQALSGRDYPIRLAADT